MKRYFKTFSLFLGTAISAELEYRANFILASLNSATNLAGSLFGLSLLYQNGHQLGGWSWHESLIVMGLFTFLEGVSASCLGPNLNNIVRHVREGTLDFILLKPIDGQFWLSTRNFSLWGLPNVLFGLVISGYAAAKLHLSLAQCLAGILPLAVSVALLYGIWFTLATTSIWLVKVHNLTFLLRSFLEAGRFPAVAYPAVYRFFFTFILPVAFLTTVPAQAMLGRARSGTLLLGLALTTLILVLGRIMWRGSLRFYTSASS